MQSLRLIKPGGLKLLEEPKPRPGPGEMMIQVKAVGLCGSDNEWFTEGGIGDSHLNHPLVLGHEFAGVIASGEREGERVAIDPAISCEVCEYCVGGNPNLCLNLCFAGHGSTDGALREYLKWPERFLHSLPDSLSDVEGAMLEPLGVAIHAVDLAKIQPGMSVGVFGSGPIGLLVIQVAIASGAKSVFATDLLAHRLEAAQTYGAYPVKAEHGNELQEILEKTAGEGVDVVFEAAGENDAVEAAVSSVKPGGRVILIGIPSDDRTAFRASTARRKGLSIKLVRRMKHTYPRAIEMVNDGLVDVESIVSHRFALTDFKKAFAVASTREGLKVIIEPQE